MDAARTLFSQLGVRRLAVMAGVALAVLAALAFVATRGTTSSMGFLFTDLDPAAAQSITEKLKAKGVDYRLSADGTSILAPQDKLAELRMAMAGDHLGGKIGYEVLDNEQSFGVSASRAKLNETRAIEGELAKSIESLDGVAKARVHIVMPERAMFATESRKSTAAVTVKTKGRLSSEAVASIRYLVASSVPELAPEAVSVVDQTGALLARAGDTGSAGGAEADERQTATEAKLRDEIESLLTPIVGMGKVRAEVSALIDRDQTREETTAFDPDKQVIGHQTTVESGDQNAENNGVAPQASVGAQLPDAQAAATGSGTTRKTASTQNSEDTTYENSSTHTVTVRVPGQIKRLSIAVMVDGGPKGLPAAQIQRLTRIVENAAGIDAKRGDSVVVESMPFTAGDALAENKSGLLSLLPMDKVFSLLELVVIAVVGIIVLRMLRPKPAAEPAMMANQAPQLGNDPERLALAARAADGDAEAMQQIAALGGEQHLLDQEIALAQVDGRIKLSALKRIGSTIAESPPESASVIRQWMNS